MMVYYHSNRKLIKSERWRGEKKGGRKQEEVLSRGGKGRGRAKKKEGVRRKKGMEMKEERVDGKGKKEATLIKP